MLYIFVATTFSGQVISSTEGTLQWHDLESVPQLARPYPDTCYWGHIINHKAGLWQGKFVYNTAEQLLEEVVYS